MHPVSGRPQASPSFRRLALLAGTAFLATTAAGAAHAQASSSPTAVAGVVVTAKPATHDQALQQDDLQANGYKVDQLSSVGALGARSVIDTPFSFSVLPGALINNIQASSPDDLLSKIPSLQVNIPDSEGVGARALSRGFAVNVGEDGFRYQTGNAGHVDVENFQRIELLSGLSGFLYGPLNPGGYLNYVLKRPTAAAFEQVTAGVHNNGGGYVHLDVGGPFSALGEKFGYRINAVGESGDQGIDGQHLDRYFLSGAFDFHPIDRAVIQVDASHSDWRIREPSMGYTFTAVLLPPPNPPSKNLSPPYAFNDEIKDSYGIRGDWSLNDVFSARAGYKYTRQWENGLFDSVSNIQPNGAFSLFANHNKGFVWNAEDYYGALDARFDLGPVANKATVSFSHNSDYATFPSDYRIAVTQSAGLNFNNPAATATAEQALYKTVTATPIAQGPKQNSSASHADNLVLGDEITLFKNLSAIVGANYATIGGTTYSATGVPTLVFNKSAWTPNVSLLYKVMPNVSVYGTYIQGLESGGTAGTTNVGLPVTNPGPQAPVIDDQYEIGAKADIHGLLATVALFQITKASNVFTLNPGGLSYTFSTDGRERHQGVEMNLSGKVTSDLTLYGGVTVFDAKITSQPAQPILVGKVPTQISTDIEKIYAEYHIPLVAGLFVTAGADHYGRQAVTNTNSLYAPGYTIGNVGARYETRLYGRDMAFRINVENVSNAAYWANGATIEGPPRLISASIQATF